MTNGCLQWRLWFTLGAHSARARLGVCWSLYHGKDGCFSFLFFLFSAEWRLGETEKGALAPAFVYILRLCIVVMADRDTESSKEASIFLGP